MAIVEGEGTGHPVPPGEQGLLTPSRAPVKAGLRTCLFRAFAPPVLIPLLVSLQLFYLFASRELTLQEQSHMEELAEAEGRRIRSHLEIGERDLVSLSRLPSVHDHFQNLDYGLIPEAEVEKQNFLLFAGQMRERAPHYAAVRLKDLEGKTKAEASAPGSPARGLVTPPLGPGGPTTGPRRVLLRDGSGGPVLACELPVVYENGRRVGSVELLVGLSVLVSDRSRMDESRGTHYFLQDAEGNVLCGSSPGYRGGALPAPGSGERPVDSSGSALIFHRFPLDVHGMSIVGISSTARLHESLWELRFRMGALVLLTLTGLGTIVFLLAQRLSRPIQELALAADAIGTRRFDTRIAVDPIAREIEVVTSNFNGMAQNLQLLDATNREYIEYLRSMQGQLVQAEKLSAMGKLTAGVAHELNNPLQSLQTNLFVIEHVLRGGGALEPRMEKTLGLMREALVRSQRIIRGLLDYGRKSGENPTIELFDLAGVVPLTLRQLEGVLAPFRVETELAGGCWAEGDPLQIQQVLINLLTNAADASPPGGRILIRVMEGTFNEGDRLMRLEVPRRATDPTNMNFDLARSLRPDAAERRRESEAAIILEVVDEGAGIAPGDVDQVFDPFFTTKPIGKGTGLGLSISQGLVKQHRGVLVLSSEPGAGTRFAIKLPRVHRETSAEVA